ncbi:MAG: GntR family transcriptional regulator [Tepidisphaeraceae bacterium]|jgi:DNA-binding transcriptional regulator YhcF (GntR family)
MDSINSPQQRRRQAGLSYKFQRLREKIRQAVASGELSGKLPGERELARRFHVNAKTLSKALTDLAAEGVLHRSIGRGTFVKSAAPQHNPSEGSWLLLVDRQVDAVIVEHLKLLNPHAEVTDDVTTLRPSYLNQFAAVVDLAAETPDAFVRDLLVRNIPVVAVGREPRTYSTNAVLLDLSLGAAALTRHLLMSGHRRFVAVEAHNRTAVTKAVRRLAPSFGSDVCVDACFPRDIVAAVENGATACICDSVRGARETLHVLGQAGIAVPGRISVTALGPLDGDYPCTGYYTGAQQTASAVAEILRYGQTGRPITLWLTGTLVDRGTIASFAPEAAEPQPEPVQALTF